MVVYDPVKKKIEKQILRNDYEGIAFTHLVSQFVDSKSDQIAVANALEYQIKIFDANLNCTDTLWRKTEGWKSFPKDYNEKKHGVYAKGLIQELLSADDTISRIEKIFFLNDSSLLVSYKAPGASLEETRHLDVWQKQNGKWSGVLFDQSIKFIKKETDTIAFDRFKPNLTLSSPLMFTDTEIIVINAGIDVPDHPMSAAEYKKFISSKYLNEEETYNIFIYKWVIK